MQSSRVVTDAPTEETPPAGRCCGGLDEFICRRRVAISTLLFGATAVYELLGGYRLREPFNYHDPVGLCGGFMVLCGLAIRSWAAGILHKNSELTTTGPYRLIRNPLYSGSILMVLGFCALFAEPLVLLTIATAMTVMYSAAIRSEERSLALAFPQQWLDYSQTTPRLIPRLGRVDLTANWQASQWMRHREYRAVAAALLTLTAIQLAQLHW